ncbi:hypothetical protein CLOM_g23632 [Closterium sp. NIES-68]|nr:hypothetical protein CLOM_g23632 [Closterium sp. NIES-68]GJP70757.1 hypothetical protein CLOP_g1664 [Closterium sp. NIES-67]
MWPAEPQADIDSLSDDRDSSADAARDEPEPPLDNDHLENGGGGRGGGGGDVAGSEAAMSEREQRFLQQLRRNSLATRERILTNVADVWISHQESESWLGQLEKLAAAQQRNGDGDKPLSVATRYGQQQHATWRTGRAFRKPHAVAGQQQQPTGDLEAGESQDAHQPRGVRTLKRSGGSATFAQLGHLPPQTEEQNSGARAREFSRTSSASSASSTSIVSGGSSSGTSGGGGRPILVSRALSRASWLFGSATRSAQERSTSRLGGVSPRGSS